MCERSESDVIREFREAVDQGELADDVRVVYRVSGGVPGERVEEEVKLSGGDAASLRSLDEQDLKAPREASAQLDPAETRRMFQQVASSLDSLVPRSQARFLPDSVVGSVTIGVRGEETTLYFLADEGQRQGQEESLAAQAREGGRPLMEISRRLKEKGGG